MVRVLVIDDDPYMRELICYALADLPYAVQEADSGNAGLLCQKRQPAHIVITDMGLPDCDGLDVIWALRCKYPNTQVMAISGGGCVAEEELFPRARAMGVKYTLTKPFHLNEMLDGVADLTNA